MVNLAVATKPQGLSPKKRLVALYNVPRKKALEAYDVKRRTDLIRKQDLESKERERELKESSKKNAEDIRKLIAIENARRGLGTIGTVAGKGLGTPIDFDEMEKRKKTLPSTRSGGLGESRNALRTAIVSHRAGTLPKPEQVLLTREAVPTPQPVIDMSAQTLPKGSSSPTKTPVAEEKKKSRGITRGIFGRGKTDAEKAQADLEKLEKKAFKEEQKRIKREAEVEKEAISVQQNIKYQENAREKKEWEEFQQNMLNAQQQQQQEIVPTDTTSRTLESALLTKRGVGTLLQ